MTSMDFCKGVVVTKVGGEEELGSGVGIELLRQDRYGGYKLKLSMCSLIFN